MALFGPDGHVEIVVFQAYILEGNPHFGSAAYMGWCGKGKFPFGLYPSPAQAIGTVEILPVTDAVALRAAFHDRYGEWYQAALEGLSRCEKNLYVEVFVPSQTPLEETVNESPEEIIGIVEEFVVAGHRTAVSPGVGVILPGRGKS